jgi:hypothetical protein
VPQHLPKGTNPRPARFADRRPATPPAATAIDAGAAAATPSAYLGGSFDQDDSATVAAIHLDSDGQQLGQVAIGLAQTNSLGAGPSAVLCAAYLADGGAT